MSAGWLVPTILERRGRAPDPAGLAHWVLAPRACRPAGMLFMVAWALSWVRLPPIDLLGVPEFREMWIAWFLLLYMASYPLRLSERLRGDEAASWVPERLGLGRE